jgi:putative ABC transport system ATP-binding protein/lipoprotein-releasing system ATP-binding protein
VEQIKIKDLSKIYKVGDNTIKAVDNVSLNINKGEFVSIIGRSGSGKTTLLSMIGGILKYSEGKVLYNGTDIYDLKEHELSRYRANNIGYIFQFASLLPVLTAKENLLLPTIFNQNGKQSKEKKAEDYLDMVGLKDKIGSYPSQLSGGQQRRVAIARALMNDPDIILADEPTGDLDEETELEIMDIIERTNKQSTVTIIFVTHNSELAKKATKKLKMTNGGLNDI